MSKKKTPVLSDSPGLIQIFCYYNLPLDRFCFWQNIADLHVCMQQAAIANYYHYNLQVIYIIGKNEVFMKWKIASFW